MVIAVTEYRHLRYVRVRVAPSLHFLREDGMRNNGILVCHSTVADDQALLAASRQKLVVVARDILNRKGVASVRVQTLADLFDPNSADYFCVLVLQESNYLREEPDGVAAGITRGGPQVRAHIAALDLDQHVSERVCRLAEAWVVGTLDSYELACYLRDSRLVDHQASENHQRGRAYVGTGDLKAT